MKGAVQPRRGHLVEEVEASVEDQKWYAPRPILPFVAVAVAVAVAVGVGVAVAVGVAAAADGGVE